MNNSASGSHCTGQPKWVQFTENAMNESVVVPPQPCGCVGDHAGPRERRGVDERHPGGRADPEAFDRTHGPPFLRPPAEERREQKADERDADDGRSHYRHPDGQFGQDILAGEEPGGV